MYSRLKEELESLLSRIPAIGDRMLKSAERAKDAFKYLFVPGILFEELGFTYLGPTDGHDLRALQNVLRRSQHLNGPVLVHVITTKGKGYFFAEKEPERFHGVGPFDPATSKTCVSSSIPTYTSVFGKTMVALGEQRPELVAITAAMKEGTGLEEFAGKFPRRFFDVGIAEQHAVTMAAGMAAAGFRPVVAIYSTFLQRALDQLLQDVAMQNLPVTFAVDRAGLVGEDGETHHGIFDLSYLRLIPSMIVMAPRDEQELRRMLVTALNGNKPAAIRYPRGAAVGVELSEDILPLPIGKGEVLHRGDDLVIFAVGSMVLPAVQAAERLIWQGIKATVVDARFIKPLDEELIVDLASGIGAVLTVEENVIAGGFGSAVGELLSRKGLNGIKQASMGIDDRFIPHGPRQELLRRCRLDRDGIAEAAARLCGKKKVSRDQQSKR